MKLGLISHSNATRLNRSEKEIMSKIGLKYITQHGDMLDLGEIYNALEAHQAKPESVAAACSGAGCPTLPEEPRGVLGPGEILAKMQAYRVKRSQQFAGMPLQQYQELDPHVEIDLMFKHLSRLLGVEANEPPQDAE